MTMTAQTVAPSLSSSYRNVEMDEDPSRYELLCETYTWTGVCANVVDCPHYHSPDRLPYLWLIGREGQWRKSHDSVKLEKKFCGLGDFIPKFSDDFCDFYVMSTKMESIGINHSTSFRRLSTPSYVDAAQGTPLHFYTQWVWYRQERDGRYTPFYPGSLQYTLEEKYLNNQDKYYFDFEELRLMVDMDILQQINLDTKRSTNLIRRPVFVPSDIWKIPEMSPLLLHDVAEHVHQVPDNWSVVDRYQDFELVELDSHNSDYRVVQRQFFLTMDVNQHKIVHIFRVQNPGLWDKYCSAKRAMIPKDRVQKGVDERQLFHGTPTLRAARGICANSFDFRRSGEHFGTVWGKGAYFSTSAKYSHKFTRDHPTFTGDPLRFMFLGRILVGQYTLGHPSYTKPPERDRLKLYDSCVNDLSNPTIFVIFDLTQSYPDYLIQYARISRYSFRDPGTSSALPSTLRHRSKESTAASTTSTATSATASRVPAGGLSTVSQAVSHSVSKQSVSRTEPGMSTLATKQPVSRPSATKARNTELLSGVQQWSRAGRAIDQQSYAAIQPWRLTLTQPMSRSLPVQPAPHSPLLFPTPKAGPVSQSASSQRNLQVQAAAAEMERLLSTSTLSQLVSRSTTAKPVLFPVNQPSTFASVPTSATAQPVIQSANFPSVSASSSVNWRSDEDCEEDMEWM